MEQGKSSIDKKFDGKGTFVFGLNRENGEVVAAADIIEYLERQKKFGFLKYEGRESGTNSELVLFIEFTVPKGCIYAKARPSMLSVMQENYNLKRIT